MSRTPGAIDQAKTLTDINTEELLDVFGLDRARLRKLARPFARASARAISARMMEYDHTLAARGLCAGSLENLPQLVGSLEVSGRDRVPRAGHYWSG